MNPTGIWSYRIVGSQKCYCIIHHLISLVEDDIIGFYLNEDFLQQYGEYILKSSPDFIVNNFHRLDEDYLT